MKRNSKLTREQVKHVGKLANISLTSQEIKKFQRELNEILQYVGQLKKVKTENIEPTSQVTGLENIFQEDEPSVSFPAKYKNYFKVKAILEK